MPFASSPSDGKNKICEALLQLSPCFNSHGLYLLLLEVVCRQALQRNEILLSQTRDCSPFVLHEIIDSWRSAICVNVAGVHEPA